MFLDLSSFFSSEIGWSPRPFSQCSFPFPLRTLYRDHVREGFFESCLFVVPLWAILKGHCHIPIIDVQQFFAVSFTGWYHFWIVDLLLRCWWEIHFFPEPWVAHVCLKYLITLDWQFVRKVSCVGSMVWYNTAYQKTSTIYMILI